MTADGFARHTPSLTGVKQIRALSIDSALMSHVSEAITQLADGEQWLEVGDSIDDIVTECWEAMEDWYSDMLIGSLSTFMSDLPQGWLALDGATYDEVDYPELYAVLDGVFKNEIAHTFTLPDSSGVFLTGAAGPVLVGDTGGDDSVSLSVDEMPIHSHSYLPPVVDIDLEIAGVPDVAAARIGAPIQTGTAGNGDAHENRPPFLALRFGVYAGRA